MVKGGKWWNMVSARGRQVVEGDTYERVIKGQRVVTREGIRGWKLVKRGTYNRMAHRERQCKAEGGQQRGN